MKKKKQRGKRTDMWKEKQRVRKMARHREGKRGGGDRKMVRHEEGKTERKKDGET